MSERTVVLELLEGPYDGVEYPLPLEQVGVCPRCGEVHDVRITMPASTVRLGPEAVPVACLPRRAPVPGDRVAEYRFLEEGYRCVRFLFRGYGVVTEAQYREREV